MAQLYNVESPINSEQRNNLNATFEDIQKRFSNLQLQISVISGGEDLDAIIQTIENAVLGAEDATADVTEVLNDVNLALSELQNALNNVNVATQTANDAVQEARNEISALQNRVVNLQNMIDNLGNATSYESSVTYQKNNVVEYNGSSFMALQQTTGNLPPTLPTKRNDHWQLLAQRGIDGEGSVSSVNGISPDVNGNIQLTQLQEIENALNLKINKDNEFMINVKNPPNNLTPAIGDGVADDTAAIQAVIDYVNANGRGTIVFPEGVYSINTTLMYKSGVSLLGSGSNSASILQWRGSNNGYILDTRNVDLSLSYIEKMTFAGQNRIGSGIIGGSTFANYNCFNIRIIDCLFHDLDIGINGRGLRESDDPKAIGIFDSYLLNPFFSSCGIGMINAGSQNCIINPRFGGCETGILMGYASPESFSGMQIFGGVFASSSGYDLSVEDARGIRNTTFVGTWFENSSFGILNIHSPNTFLSVLSFRDCQINSKDTQFGMMNFYNAIGSILIDNCVLTQVLANETNNIIPPSNLNNGTSLKINHCLVVNADGTSVTLNRSYYDNWQNVTYANGWNDASADNVTRYMRDSNNVVHLQITMAGGIASNNTEVFTLPSGFRPERTIRFNIFDGTNGLIRSMYLLPTGVVAIQEITGQALTTGVWSGYVTFKADL